MKNNNNKKSILQATQSKFSLTDENITQAMKNTLFCRSQIHTHIAFHLAMEIKTHEIFQ